MIKEVDDAFLKTLVDTIRIKRYFSKKIGRVRTVKPNYSIGGYNIGEISGIEPLYQPYYTRRKINNGRS